MRGRPVAPAIHSSITGGSPPRIRRVAADPGDLRKSRTHRGPQADEVIVERVNPVSADRRLHDPNSQRREARRPAGRVTRFELVINLKTARSLGVKISDNLLSIADEMIE